MAYLFDHKWKAERERLAKMEEAADPFTIERLEYIGVARGWRCLEVGAGGGSISEWLSHRVGPDGKVVATDLETKFLEAIDAANLEVRVHNIATEDIETSAFDLVFSRKVLEHMNDPTQALNRMHAALKPGGWMLIEDTDLVSLQRISSKQVDLFNRVYSAFIDAIGSAGFNATFGSELGDQLRALGLKQVEVRGMTAEWTAAGDHPVGAVYRMTVEKLRNRIEERGRVSSEDIDNFLNEIQSPDFHAITGVHFGASGRKPNA